MKKNKTTFVLLAALISNVAFSGQYDVDKMHSVSNIVLGIDPTARGDRFELIKNNPLSPDMLHSTNVITGAAVAGAIGSNPVSVSGAGIANKVTVGLDLLSILGSKKEKVYADSKTQGQLFGKVYLKGNFDTDAEATKAAMLELSTRIGAATKEAFNVEPDYDYSLVDKQIDKLAKDVKKDVKVISIVSSNLDENNRFFARITMHRLAKPAFKNTQLQFDYSYENAEPYELTIGFFMFTKGKVVSATKDFVQDETYNKIFAKITEGGDIVLFTPNLKNTYYDGNHYVEESIVKG